MNTKSQLQNFAQGEIESRYQETFLRLREVLKKTGRIYLNSPSAQKRFMALSLENQTRALNDINSWCEVMEDYMAAGGVVTKTRELSRYYFNRLGVTLDPSFITTIEDGDVVEIFDSGCRRLFFNPELFDFSSYSPDEMFSSPLWELYRREDNITQQLGAFTTDLLRGGFSAPVKPDVDKHIVSEIASERRYSCEIDIKMCAPMYVGRTIMGFVAIEKFRLLLS